MRYSHSLLGDSVVQQWVTDQILMIDFTMPENRIINTAQE